MGGSILRIRMLEIKAIRCIRTIAWHASIACAGTLNHATIEITEDSAGESILATSWQCAIRATTKSTTKLLSIGDFLHTVRAPPWQATMDARLTTNSPDTGCIPTYTLADSGEINGARQTC